MEESSVKRRERLQGMRLDASSQSQSQPQSQSQSQSPSPSLSNPLLNTSSYNAASRPQRFDFYTDPVGAFSAGPRNYPASHLHQNHSPNQGSWRSPIQHSPFSGNVRGTPPCYNPNPSPNYNPNYSHNSNSWSQAGSNLSRPNFRSRGSPVPTPRFSPRPSHGGRREGYYNELQQYYLKTMSKDPWRKLKPVVGNILVPRLGSRSWLPKSLAAPKRVKIAESGGKPQLSLAESLALSLEEATNAQ